ncbi:MAG: hypothetical protein COA86_16160 [Kangiella sp.]|nr:MAG: hypothetical protein COA86_16160 [Kangiella sp.]
MKHLSAKLKAFSIHLILSGLIVGAFLLAVTQLWYPGVLFEIEDVWEGLQILIPVDAILGPLLTLVLFLPGKKGLMLDLTVIALLQLSALFYGGYTIYQQRPIGYVFVVDRFEVVVASEPFIADIPMERFKDEPQGFPFMSYVKMARSAEERSKSITSGVNFKNVGDRHYTIRDNIDDILANSIQLADLKPKNEAHKLLLEDFIERNRDKKNLILLPLQGTTYKTSTIVLNRETLVIQEYLPFSIWDW